MISVPPYSKYTHIHLPKYVSNFTPIIGTQQKKSVATIIVNLLSKTQSWLTLVERAAKLDFLTVLNMRTYAYTINANDMKLIRTKTKSEIEQNRDEKRKRRKRTKRR